MVGNDHINVYEVIYSPRSLGFGVTAFVSIMMDSHTKDMALAFEQRLMEIPEIVACHNISGRYDFLLEILARDLESFGEFTREVLQRLPGGEGDLFEFFLQGGEGAASNPCVGETYLRQMFPSDAKLPTD